MEEMGKRLCCPKCGKKMKIFVAKVDMFPMGIMVSSLPDSEYLSTLRRYQCPEKHVGIILIPVRDFDERQWDAMKRRRYSGWE